jgi:GNAT superfamily N-acetyltransferase
VIYSVEVFGEIEDEVINMALKAWLEVDSRGAASFNPNIAMYNKLQEAGALRVYTIRDKGVMVGCALFLVSESLHSMGKYHAATDFMYIEKDFRGLGSELINLAAQDMKEEGVNWFSFVVKAHADSGALGEETNATLYEHVYNKRLR